MSNNPARDQWDQEWAEFRERLARSRFFSLPPAEPGRAACKGAAFGPDALAGERLKRLALEQRIDALEVALGLHLDEAAKYKAEREALVDKHPDFSSRWTMSRTPYNWQNP